MDRYGCLTCYIPVVLLLGYHILLLLSMWCHSYVVHEEVGNGANITNYAIIYVENPEYTPYQYHVCRPI